MERKRLERRQIPTIPNDGRALRSIPAWALSLLFHVSLITLLGVFWVARPNGTGGQDDRPIGIAIVYESAGQTDYYTNGDGQSNTSEAASNLQDLLASTETSSTSATETELLSELFSGSSSAGADTGAAAGAFGLGDGGGSLGGSGEVPKVKTSVFGIEGEGSRFLYVFDRSDSMNGYGGAPIQSAKSELLQSLQSLGPSHQFQIIFYNDSPLPFGGLSGAGPRLLRGDDKDKSAAQRFVRDVAAVGGTQHTGALQMAMRMNPDVVFFLTDADAAPPTRDIERLHTQAARIGATIHTIQFGSGSNQSGGGWIEFLASQTGGKYRYIDVSKLRLK
ncbi:MAG: hypothetical protein AAGG44_15400 [Planctomycetota bacterium]